jgi:cellulase/cellobiase CelA1
MLTHALLLRRDTVANIERLSTELSNGVPCENILGLVIYDLPGRDCAAKASNGELAAGDISTYKSSYIDRKCSLPMYQMMMHAHHLENEPF